MKIYLDNVDLRSESGPNTFAKRLVKELSNSGVKVLWQGDMSKGDPNELDYDASLSFITRTNFVREDRPNILRLDGIWFKESDIELGANNDLMRSYAKADSVIVQSKFDSRMIELWFGKKKHHVIRNGIETKSLDVINLPDSLYSIRKEFKTIFVSCSNWHGQKRLKDNIELFKFIEKESNFESMCMIIIGQPNVMASGKNIFYTGKIDNESCQQIFQASDWLIHLAWLDHCPNVVLESLNARTPVICTNSGGTHEILRGKRNVNDIGFGKNGIVLPDHSYNFEPNDYDNPLSIPKESFEVISSLLDTILKNNVTIDTRTFDISDCVSKYINVIKSVVVS